MKPKLLRLAITGAAILLCKLEVFPVSAQIAVPPPMPAYQPLSDQQLDQLLGPIALYPDTLLAILLPAVTLPAQIVLADRYVIGGGDPSQIDLQPWDSSVCALAHYPAVLKYLDDNLAWTTEVGEAFLNQQQEVLESIQRLRLSAQNFGNLESTPQQQVVDDGGDIEILPAETDVIYVPVYLPNDVYFQSGFGPGFGVGCAIGPWLNCDFDWIHYTLRCWDPHHPRPAGWWQERADQRTASLASQTTAWQPANQRGSVTASRGDRGWAIPAARAPQPRYNPIVNMSKPAVTPRASATPRPAATPAPAVVRDSGAFQLPNRPAPPVSVSPASSGAFIGSESSQAARNFSDRGQESMQTVRPPEPVHSEPAQPEPAHNEPAHSEPPVSPPAPPPPADTGGSHDSGSRR
jgi:hypothetical protein